FFFSSRRRHTRFSRDWSSDVCSSDLRLAQHVAKHFGVTQSHVCGCEPARTVTANGSLRRLTRDVVMGPDPGNQLCRNKLTEFGIGDKINQAPIADVPNEHNDGGWNFGSHN